MNPPIDSVGSVLDGSDLDKDLLAALDDMLAFSNDTDTQPIETGCHLADAFGPNVSTLSTADSAGQLAMHQDANATLLEMQEMSPLLTVSGQQDVAMQQPQPTKTASPAQEPGRKGKDVRTTPYPKKPRRRKRPKDELDYLRAQVKNLEEELGNLSGVNGSSESEGDGAGDQDDKLFTQWKKIAERQKVEADHAMVENLKLRSMLEGQLRVARSLQAAIQNQQQEAAELLSQHQGGIESVEASGGNRRPRAWSMSDDLIFAQLNMGLEAQYAQFDSVLEGTGISREFQKSHDIQVLREGKNVAFRQEEARLLPFSMPAVHRAMWSCIRYGKAKELSGRVRLRVVNNDHLNATIVDELHLPGSHSVTTCARIAMRRYFEQGRIVLVWSAYVEVAGSLFVRLHEKGYTSASPFDFSNSALTSSSNAGVPGCVMRMALQIKPEMTDFDSDQEAQEHIGEVTDLVVGSYHRNFGLMYQVIERLLFNDATGGAADEHELERYAAYKNVV